MNIQIDEFGFCDLNEIFRQANLPEHKRPGEWMKRKSTKELVQYVDITIHQVNLPDGRINNLHPSCCYVVNNGMYKGVFANEILALDYAAFVSVELRCEIYKEYLDRHSLAESINKCIQLKADALDAMCNKGSTMTVTEAACQISKVVGYNISCRWLNDFLCEDHYKFKHWYDQKSGGGRKSNWIQEVKIRKYVDESYSIDKFGNRHKQLRITSRGAQYLAEWLNRYHAVFPRKP